MDLKAPKASPVFTGTVSGSGGLTITGGGVSGTNGLKFGSADYGYGGFWVSQLTPNGNNYAMITNGDATYVNGGYSCLLLVGNVLKLEVLSAGVTVTGNLGFSQSRFNQSAAQTLRTQCYDTSLQAWQETTRQQASPSGSMLSVMGATPILRQTHAALATDLATAITRLNQLCTHLTNFGFFN